MVDINESQPVHRHFIVLQISADQFDRVGFDVGLFFNRLVVRHLAQRFAQQDAVFLILEEEKLVANIGEVHLGAVVATEVLRSDGHMVGLFVESDDAFG